jgi:hypothetical protein
VGTGLTGEEHRSDRCATMQSGIFEAEDTSRDRKACVEAKQVAVAGHPSDGESEDHVWFEDRWMVASLCDE